MASGYSGRMTPGERKAAGWLACLASLRTLGLFMILPVFALYAETLRHTTPALLGLAIGVYGFSQALLQIPFGMLSDRYGRKRLIVLGLVIFALGSVVAAVADSIWGVIAGRALQGAGAVSAAVMALAADLTREEQRTKAMAVIGLSIGLAFAASMVLGPVLNGWIGVAGIFWLTAVLALGGILVVRFLVPQPAHSRPHRDSGPMPEQLFRVITDPQLLRFNAGILVLHMLLTATFVALPLALRDQAGLAADRHWQVYLPALALSLAIMVPLVLVAEKRRCLKPVFLGAILLLCLTQLGLLNAHFHLLAIGALLTLFFAAFNLLEAMLPSLISRMAPVDARGTAMGVYTSSQFLGAFIGGAAGGWMMGTFGLNGAFAFAAVAALVWLLFAWTMKNPRYLSSYLLNVGVVSEAEAQRLAMRLTQVRGVAEAVVIAVEGVAYLRVDRHALDEPALLAFAAAEA
ncbi:MAG: MFS transporter [Pseudomonadota bacterium]|nr:MFS transporter [Pseudomonadota bacterium]